MRFREAWRFHVKGDFLGSFLDVHPDGLVFKFARPDNLIALAGVAPDGSSMWEGRWPGLAYFFSSDNEVFVDGERVRVLSAASGRVLRERDLGVELEIRWLTEHGPVFEVPDERRYLGLDRRTLEVLWEWYCEGVDPTPEAARLCSYDPCGQITVRDIPSLLVSAQAVGPPMPSGAAHGHCGDVFCLFAYTNGGRAGVNLMTGTLEWRHAEPIGYGLTVFDTERAYSPRDGLSAYDLRTGALLWTRRFEGVPSCAPALLGNRVLAASTDGAVHVLEADTGEILGSHQLRYRKSGAIEPAPVVPWGEKRLVVGTRREIICLEIEG